MYYGERTHTRDTFLPPGVGDVLGWCVTCASEPGTRKHSAVAREMEQLLPDVVTQECLHALLPRVIHQEPQIEEKTIQGSVGALADKGIAVLKSQRSTDAVWYRTIRRHLADTTPLLEILQGTLLRLSYANDVMTVIVLDGKPVMEYKLSPESTKEDVLAHLRATIGRRKIGRAHV